MEHGQLTHQVRTLVAQRFGELGIECSVAVRETILIREGIYCGRRFEAGGAEAIWLAEEDRLVVRVAENEQILAFPSQAEPATPLSKAA